MRSFVVGYRGLRAVTSALLLTVLGCGGNLAHQRAAGLPDGAASVSVPVGLEFPAFELHTLDNGLRVVTVENHAHPIVGLTAYVTTGGRTESPHFAGALHFIEHLVFKGGTRRFPPTTFRKRIAALGDENGGWTWDDEIQFGFQVPKHNFSEALDLFTESLLELEWNERWFEDERQVVLQEIEKVGERPWHRIWNAWDALAFSKHPYGRPVIGDAQTVRAQTLSELHRYYRDRFSPNHTILIVVGDFETTEMVTQIRRRFQRYRRGPASFELQDVREPEQEAPRFGRLEDESARNVRFLLGFRTPGAAHPDTPGLLLLAKLLSSTSVGLPAYLTRSEQWVTHVGASHSFMVDYGHLVVSGEMGTENEQAVLSWLRDYLITLPERPYAEEAVQEAAHSLLMERARSWESFGEQAQGVGFWIERMGPDAVRSVTARILAHTPESLAALAARTLTASSLVQVVLAPPASDASSATLSPQPSYVPVPSLEKPGLLQPAQAEPWTYRRVGQRGDTTAFEFDSGLTLLVRRVTANDLISAVAWMKGGQWVEEPAQAGIAVLTARALRGGSQHLTIAEWDRLLTHEAIAYETALRFSERSNVPRNVHARDGSVFSLQGTIQQLERTLSLLGEALYRPTFPAEEVSRAQQVLLAEIDSIPEDNLEYIKQEMYRRVYAGHPYGRPTVGDRSTVEGLGREQVLAFHQANYTPDRTIVAVNGDVDPERVANWIATRWSDVQTLRAGPLPVAAPPPPPLPETRQHTLEVGRDQWCVNMGRTTLNAVDIRFPTLEVLVAITRGRHFYKYVYEKGVSYRSWIKLWEHRSPSLWLVENDVARTRFDSVLEDIRADLQEYGRGIFSAEEVQLAATRLINRDLLDAQNGSYAALRLARGVALGHSFDYLSRRREALHGMTREAVNSLAREVFGARAVYELILR